MADESAFDELLRVANEQQQIDEEREVMTLRFQTRLEDMGERFPDPAAMSRWWKDEAELETRFTGALQVREEREERDLTSAEIDEEASKFLQEVALARDEATDLIYRRAVMDARLNMLVTYRVVFDHVEVDHETVTGIKKSLQAEFQIEGYSDAWQQLIADEFPGEPLTMADGDILEETRREIEKRKVRSRAIRVAEEALVADTLRGVGVTIEPGSRESVLLARLGSVAGLAVSHGNQVSLEDARLTLIEEGVTDPRWFQAIEKLYGEQTA